MGVKCCIILHNISVSTNTKSKMGSSNRMSDHIWLTPEKMGCKHVCPYSFLTCIVILTVLKMSPVTRAIQKAECLLKLLICRKNDVATTTSQRTPVWMSSRGMEIAYYMQNGRIYWIFSRLCGLKGISSDIFQTANMGSVIMFTGCLLMPELCLITAMLNRTGGITGLLLSSCLSLPKFP